MLAPNEPIRLVVGLGNPGSKYESTRHNAGFWFVDALARDQRTSLSSDRKFFGDVGKLRGKLGGKIGSECWLLKPQTFMNRSGQAVGALANFFQIAPVQILVVHDELDLKPGEVKLKLGGGVAGHNGLKDVREKLGTADFWRLRVGIGHPREQSMSEQEVADYVLHRPSADHQTLIDVMLEKCLAVWPTLEAGDMEKAMHLLHTKPKPPKPPKPALPSKVASPDGAPGVPPDEVPSVPLNDGHGKRSNQENT